MSRHFEARTGSGWRFDLEHEAFRAQLRGIVGFRFAPGDLVMKFKLNQNHPPANRAAVRDAFARSSDPGAVRLAAWMAEHGTDPSPTPHTPSE
jgi:transcriptional regulator